MKQQTGEDVYQVRALQLVDQAHQVLGRHRGDDSRSGWISGLDEEESRAQRSATWTSHLDINRVMLAASLVPGGYL
ncbi:MAG: hypothetical protein ABR512_10785 [Desulfopila sp.]